MQAGGEKYYTSQARSGETGLTGMRWAEVVTMAGAALRLMANSGWRQQRPRSVI